MVCSLVGAHPVSILEATIGARHAASLENDLLKVDHFENIIDHLKNEKAVLEPSITQERARRPKSVMKLPLWSSMMARFVNLAHAIEDPPSSWSLNKAVVLAAQKSTHLELLR